MSESKQLLHHLHNSRRDGSGTCFNDSIQPHNQLAHDVNTLQNDKADGNSNDSDGVGQPYHYVPHHKRSGGQNLMSELSYDDAVFNNHLNGSKSAPELQGMRGCQCHMKQ